MARHGWPGPPLPILPCTRAHAIPRQSRLPPVGSRIPVDGGPPVTPQPLVTLCFASGGGTKDFCAVWGAGALSLFLPSVYSPCLYLARRPRGGFCPHICLPSALGGSYRGGRLYDHGLCWLHHLPGLLISLAFMFLFFGPRRTRIGRQFNHGYEFHTCYNATMLLVCVLPRRWRRALANAVKTANTTLPPPSSHTSCICGAIWVGPQRWGPSHY
jgi:hypothetical protein